MRGGNEEEQVRYTEGQSVSEMGGRETRKGRYRNISSQTKEDGMGGAKIGMTMVGKRAGVIADSMTCSVVRKKYKSTRVQCRETNWLMFVRVEVEHLDGTCLSC